jgi:hypothetical protein
MILRHETALDRVCEGGVKNRLVIGFWHATFDLFLPPAARVPSVALRLERVPASVTAAMIRVGARLSAIIFPKYA